MKYAHILVALCCSVCLLGCGEEKRTDLFDYSDPVNLSTILQAYDWYQHYEGENKDSTLYSMVDLNLPEDNDIYLFVDTSFVLRVSEYEDSNQPFLANAEDFYNSCALSWNVWSNHEVWYRGHTAGLLRNDEDVMKSIEAVSVNIIKDGNVRKAAQNFKDSLILIMKTEPDEWDEDFSPMSLVFSYNDVIESSVVYKFFDDEKSFNDSLSCAMPIAWRMAMDKYQHYLDADEDEQAEIMLGEMASCKTFDEQCSLWCNWANYKKSSIDDEWIAIVGCALMKSGKYSFLLNNIWISWRAICQCLYFGGSRDSSIPNDFYNEYRKMCYTTCLNRIARHPDDVYAMNCAAASGGRSNLNRFGRNLIGNEAMIEMALMLPERYDFDDKSKDGTDEEE